MRYATIARIEKTGWRRDGETETCVVTAVLTDGRTVERVAKIDYRPQERQKMMERLVHDAAAGRSDWEGEFMRGVFLRRAKALETVYGELQREFSCTPAVEAVAS